MSKNYEDPLTEYLVLQIKLDIDVRANADDNRETILNPLSHQQMRRRRKRKNSTSMEQHTQLSSYNHPKHIPDIDRRSSSHRVLRPAQEQDKHLQLYADWLTRCDQIGEALDIYAFVASHYSDRCIPLAQLKALSSTVIDYISSTSATAAKTASLPPSPLPPSVRRAPPASSSSLSMDDGYTIVGGAMAAMEPSLNANAVSCDRLQDRVRYSKNKRIQRYWKDGGGGGGGGGGAGTVGLYDDDHARFCDALLSDPSEVDPLLCPICKDILRCPVTANCGHSFCRDCCDSATMCIVCRVKFPASSACPPTAAAAAIVSSEFSSSANLPMAGQYNSNSNLNASQYMDFATAAAAAATDRGGALVPEIDNTNTNSLLRNHSHAAGGISNDNHSASSYSNNNSMKFMPDVLVRRLVEKWWGADLQAKTINERAASFMSLNLLDDALTFCNASLENRPNNFKSLLLRAEVLRKLNHYQSSLADIDHALRIKSSSAKAHYHRSLALCGLGRFDEALVAQCVAISLDDKNSTLSSTELFQHDLAKLLQKLLAQSPKKIHLNSSPASAPYDIVPESRRRRKQIGLLNGFDGDNTIRAGAPTDCDLLRQGSRKHCRRKSYSRNQKQEVQVNFFGSTRFECVLERAQQEVQRIRESESDVDRAQQHLIPVNPSLIDPTDFDCVLCCRTLWKPVVTPCGHTYCWVCLDRSMYYSPSCPLCMSPLVEQHVKVLQGSSSPVPFMLAKRPVTKFLEAAMKRFIPERYEKRFRQEMNQESSVPLFICTTAFPHVPCPLFVYEPRYRLMVRRAVESGKKQFGIVQSHSGKSRYFDVGTILDIRDCVLLGDGCSILSTIGCKRFRILARNEKDGYDTAKVEYIYDEIITEDNVSFISSMHASVLSKAIEWYKSLGTELKEEILRSFGEMPAVEENWESIADGPAWAWWIIALLPLNQQLKVDILATTSLEKRLRAIEKTLDCMSGNFKRSHQSCVVVHREGIQPCQAVECCQRSSSELSSSSDSHTTSEHSQLML